MPSITESQPVRIPSDVHAEASRIAALKGERAGELLAKAWREFFDRHRTEFAEDLEEAAAIVRTGTTDELTTFVNRGATSRAEEAVSAIEATRRAQ